MRATLTGLLLFTATASLVACQSAAPPPVAVIFYHHFDHGGGFMRLTRSGATWAAVKTRGWIE